ncbi:unnamed protein product [Oncorhynchus mykiss]|uniref:Cadherin domain-containing protein n=1 Tax=Oncorhynchus mykiss TaxID=8022 RepID=A0A060VTJ6_ONCMY|nr:unnamed protein product [Oncorhynchus mykiss]
MSVHVTVRFIIHAEQDNGHPLPAYADLIIDILDENNQAPYFQFQSYQGYVSESSPVGTTISASSNLTAPLGIIALDNDIEESKDPLVTVTLDDLSTIFDITPTGITRYLRLLKPVDREKQMTYTFTMMASDGIQESTRVTINILVIDANDNTPTFGEVSDTVEVFTDMQPGKTVLQVISTSLSIFLSLVLFLGLQINLLSYNNIGHWHEHSIPAKQSIYCVLQQNSSSITTVYIKVLPPNNQSPPCFPLFTYDLEVSEAMRIGAILLNLQATDRENDSITYQILSGDIQQVFNLSKT